MLIGSERGFCGNFNERVLAALENLPQRETAPTLLLVGHRLGTKLEAHPGVVAKLDGATVTEDVPTVLNRLMDALHIASRRLSGDGAALYSIAHDADGEPTLMRLLPLKPPQPQRLTHPPRLQLAPAELFAELLDQYLLAVLYGLLYESLAAENRQRLAIAVRIFPDSRTFGALRHSDDQIAMLTRRPAGAHTLEQRNATGRLCCRALPELLVIDINPRGWNHSFAG